MYIESDPRPFFSAKPPFAAFTPTLSVRRRLPRASRGIRFVPRLSSKPFSVISFADPHLLTLSGSYRSKNMGRGHVRYSNPHPRKSFTCNTYVPPRKCCKQKTYCLTKPFRCNTYKKQGVASFKPSISLCAWSVSTSHLPYALPSSVSYNSFICHSYEGNNIVDESE